MVSYQAWVSICFETLQDRGVEVSDIDDGASIMEFAASVWNRRSDRLARMGHAEARSAALQAARYY